MPRRSFWNRTPRRARAPRQTVVIEHKQAARTGQCKACRGSFVKDSDVSYVRWRPVVAGIKGVGVTLIFHRHCEPSPTVFDAVAPGAQTSTTSSTSAPQAPRVAAPRPTMPKTMPELTADALLAFETMFRAKMRATSTRDANGALVPPPALAAAFDKYNKIKAIAVRPGTPAEGDTAMRMALIQLVKEAL